MSQPMLQSPITGAVRHLLRTPTSQLWHPRMVAYWPFEAGGRDASGNGHDLTLFGTTDAEGRYGRARSFDGSDDYGATLDSNAHDLTDEMTVTAWVKSSNASGTRDIATKSTAGSNPVWRFHLLNGNARFGWHDGTTANYASSSTLVADGNWHFMAGQAKVGQFVRVKVDGVTAANNTNVSSTGVVTGQGVRIGSLGGSTAFFDGVIDEVTYWNAILSDADLNRLMHGLDPLEL